MRREIIYQHVLRAVCAFAPEFWALGIRHPRSEAWMDPGTRKPIDQDIARFSLQSLKPVKIGSSLIDKN